MCDAEWTTCSITCTICSHDWIATYPTEARVLECPVCGFLNPAPPLDVEEDSYEPDEWDDPNAGEEWKR